MSFDPSGQPDESGQDDGQAAVDLLELPTTLYRIMRLMLRHVEMDFDHVRQGIEALPEAERLSASEIEDGLRALVEQNWLIRTDGADQTTYRANFRRKIGNLRSTAAPRTRTGNLLLRGIWDALDANPPEEPTTPDGTDNQDEDAP